MSPLERIRTVLVIILGLTTIYMAKGQLECKITTVGKEYEGSKNVTVSGRRCQAWGSQYPHKHTLGERESLVMTGSKCRNPDGTPGGPWCYTLDRNKRWEFCGIPLCRLTDDDCYEEGKGHTYLGKVNVTESGFPCRRWDSEEAFVYQVFKGQENYCRSPDNAPFPWCLSSAPGRRWEKCRIPVCGATETTTTTTTSTTKKLKQDEKKPSKAEELTGEKENKCISNTLNIEIITVVTFGCVLLILAACVYITLVLRRNLLQPLKSAETTHKAPARVNNAYDVGYTDNQPIVNSNV